MTRDIISRKICWPEFDAVCLQGGCGYCNDQPFRTLVKIRDKAALKGLAGDFLWGLEHDFCNAQVLRPLKPEYGPKLTKAGLIELIKDYPDDTPIVVSNKLDDGPMRYLEDAKTQPVVWSVSNAKDRIVLEV